MRTMYLALAGVAVIIICFSGCGYQIRYALNDEETPKARNAIPMNVQIVPFEDIRDPVEKVKEEREKKGQSDLSDYTYDSEFQGEVRSEISNMLLEHFNHSWMFTHPVRLANQQQGNISASTLEQLSGQGIDGVLTGEIEHFYGYYDQNLGSKLLYSIPLGVASGLLLNAGVSTEEGDYQVYWYGPGLVIGYYLESLHDRHIEYRTLLHAKLISTSTQQVIWENDCDISYSGEKDMPGFNTEERKFDVAVASLRDAVNVMVVNLSDNKNVIMERKDQAFVELERRERPSPARQDITPSTAAAIVREHGFRYGLSAGLNLASVSGYEDGTSKNRTGFTVGVRLTYRMNDNFAIRTAASYSTKGQKYEYTSVSPSGTSTAYITGNSSFSYADIPVVGIYYPTNEISLFAGPQFSFFLDGNWESDVRVEGAITLTDHGSGTISSDDINSMDVGIQFGAGYSFGLFDIEGRYTLGVTDYSKSDNEDTKHNVIQVVLGVNF